MLPTTTRPVLRPWRTRNVTPWARPELVLIGIERLPDAERRVHGAPGVVLVRHGGAEQRHDPVTEELVDRPLVAMHLGEHQLERPRS